MGDPYPVNEGGCTPFLGQDGEGGYPIPGLKRGEPIPRSGWGRQVPHPRSRWGGVPHPRSGEGEPIPRSEQGRGIPHSRSRWEGTPSQVWIGGTPFPGQDGGVPHPRSGWGRGTLGYPFPNQDWMWYSLCQGYPPPIQETEQHSEHLLRGGRYASCVHAGGLSCYDFDCPEYS